MINRMEVERIKKTYLPGMRIRLLKMDDMQAPPIGTEGIVLGVDDVGWQTESAVIHSLKKPFVSIGNSRNHKLS